MVRVGFEQGGPRWLRPRPIQQVTVQESRAALAQMYLRPAANARLAWAVAGEFTGEFSVAIPYEPRLDYLFPFLRIGGT